MTAKREERIEAIKLILLKGKNSIQDAKDLYTERGWEIKDRQLSNDRREAWESIKGELAKRKQYLYSEAIARLDHLYNKAYEDGNIRECLSILKEQNRIFGLY